MTSLECSTDQGGNEKNEEEETKLANQVVEPMSRDNEKETETFEENAGKTKSTGVPEDVRNLTRDNSGSIGLPLCFICCACCGYILCFPCVQCYLCCKFVDQNECIVLEPWQIFPLASSCTEEMSSLESLTEHGGDDNDPASCQPKILTDERIDPMANGLRPEKDDTKQEMSETKLTNQLVEPMSRGDDDETETLEENAARPGELKTKTKGLPDDVRNLTRDSTMDLLYVSVCCICCACCSGACAFLLCLPCAAVAMVWRCIV